MIYALLVILGFAAGYFLGFEARVFKTLVKRKRYCRTIDGIHWGER